MTLAIFDLDNTLIAGDSDHRWGEYLCERGLADPGLHKKENDRFFADYNRGSLDIGAYLRFALGPIAGMTIAEVATLQQDFVGNCIEPMLLTKAFSLLEAHRQQGHTLLIISASNTVVTGPIAERLGVTHLIGSDAEIVSGCYSGRPIGTPAYREGKVTRLFDWLKNRPEELIDDAWFYSDSHNDLPLLSLVDHPVVVDPDPTLAAHAATKEWPVISLRDQPLRT